MHPEEGRSLSLTFVAQAEGQFSLVTKLDHILTPWFELSTVLESRVSRRQGKNEGQRPLLQGTLWSKYSLIDYKPIDEISGQFEVRDGRLHLQALRWGENIVKGYIGLSAPYECQLVIVFSEVPAAELAELLGLDVRDIKITGFFDGVINLSGFLDQPLIQGRVESVEGVMDELEYDSMVLNFEGLFPYITFKDAVISQTNGLVFDLKGQFDLTKAGPETIEQEIAKLEFSPLVAESMEHREWTIKRNKEEGTSSLTEFKYRLKKKTESNAPYESDADMLGVERSIKF